MVSLFPVTASKGLNYSFNSYDKKISLTSPDNISESSDIIEFLLSNNFKKFAHILILSNLKNVYLNNTISRTLFIPNDNDFDDNVYRAIINSGDIHLAFCIVKYSTLEYRINKNFMSSIRATVLKSSYQFSKDIILQNFNNNFYLNSFVHIKEPDSYTFENYIIHTTHKLLIPKMLS